MEKCQKELIVTHLSDLIVFTICKEPLLTFMQEKGILSFVDVDTISAIREETGAAKKFYDIILTRTQAFPNLLEGLRKTNQQDILDLLKTGKLPDTVSIQQRTEELFGIYREAILFDVRAPDVLFSGRKNDIDLLHTKIKERSTSPSQQCIIVVSGLGGMGKTELCRKYIEMYKRDFRDTVIWMNAETDTSLAQCFTRLAREALHISSKDVDGKEFNIEAIINKVYKYLEKRRCLIVFDNVERGDYLRKYLPLSRVYPEAGIKPTILMTSRECEWERQIEVIKLSELTREDAATMIQIGLDEAEITNEDCMRLADRLQNFPLALRQAISYIREQHLNPGSNYNIQNYLDDFEESRKEMLAFHNSPVCTQLTNDYSWTTFTTWRLTINRIDPKTSASMLSRFRAPTKMELIGKAAMKILYCVTYIKPDVISVETLKKLAGIDGEGAVFHDALRLLLKYSIISGEKESFSIHRLVQEVTKLNLVQQNMEHMVLSTILEAFWLELDTDCVNHAMIAWNHSDEIVHGKFPDLPLNIMLQLSLHHRNLEGFQFGKGALDDLRKVRRSEWVWPWRSAESNDSLLNLMFQLGVSLQTAGRFSDALDKFGDVLAQCSKTPNTPARILTYKVYLQTGICLYATEKFTESIENLEKAREGFLRLKADDEVVECDYHLAHAYSDIGSESSVQKAVDLFRKCCQELENSGKRDLLIRAAQNLGYYLISQGHVEEAQKILTKNVEREKDLRGEIQAACSGSALYLARILRKEGRLEEALEANQKMYEARKALCGENELNTLVNKEHVAVNLSQLERYKDYLDYIQQVHDSYVGAIGLEENHVRVLGCKEYIAHNLVGLKEPEKAFEIYRFVLSAYKSKFGDDHPKIKLVKGKILELDCNAFVNHDQSQEDGKEGAISSFNAKGTDMLGTSQGNPGSHIPSNYKHVTPSGYNCKICLKGFKYFHQVKDHEKQHVNGTCKIMAPFCKLCNKTFEFSFHLSRHKRMKHPNKLQKLRK